MPDAAADTAAAATVKLPLGPLMVDLAGESLTAAEADFLRHPAVGAVLLFARNYRNKAQLSELVAAIKSLRAPKLLVAVDQEGGRVQRLRAEFSALPAPASLGQRYDRDRDAGLQAAAAAGQSMASEVAQVGVDFSFAPVVDLANPQSAVIATRAFHREPGAVAALAGAFITGMNQAGMAATLKHFPGHAGVAADSHHALPVDPRPLAALENRDLMPFAALASRAGGVMTAHIQFPRVDAHAPTYSTVWLREILRARLGFDGVIFSDDLSMAGATLDGDGDGGGDGDGDPSRHPRSPRLKHCGGDESGGGDGDGGDMAAKCLTALAAGCDMALVCNDPDGAREAADALVGFAPDQARLAGMRFGATSPSPPQSVKRGR